MFTQCPECNVAFRVTAKVLQQAAGNVRCGGCNHAFNALHYLSEEMPPTSPEISKNADNDELAETSRRLLKTLDELAGPEEVRIEDTGVEWRVLDKNSPDISNHDVGEMRYDDSTMLPEDFGPDGDEADMSPELARRSADQTDAELTDFNDLQGELLLSEPEDWTDLLDEVSDPETESESLEIEEELADIHNQLSAREEASAVEASLADLDSQFGTQAEATGPSALPAEDALTDEVPLLDKTELERLADTEENSDDDSDVVVVLEDEATEMSRDVSLEDAQDVADNDFAENANSGSYAVDEDSLAEALDRDDQEGVNFAADDESPDHEIPDDDEGEFLFRDRESTGEFESQIDAAARALADEDDSTDDEEEAAPLSLEGELPEEGDYGTPEHIVPPPTEEEMTVNMEIDQEMMALATQDDEFSATLFGVENPEDLFNQNADEVETIIMEGDFVRGSIEMEQLAAESTATSQFDDPASLVDTYAMRRGKARARSRKHGHAGYGMIIGVVVLALALAGQFIHNSRETLATTGLFNQTVAPIYRMLGSPVTPAWDIKGWQFEATKGNVNEGESLLTIVSRIGNRSKRALPYPLVHVSLTDRWEDVMGSRILEPAEYLAGDLDPSSPVLAGENFTAVITIENPSAEATGFKLNVCYRVSAGTVRCAIEDFKD